METEAGPSWVSCYWQRKLCCQERFDPAPPPPLCLFSFLDPLPLWWRDHVHPWVSFLRAPQGKYHCRWPWRPQSTWFLQGLWSELQVQHFIGLSCRVTWSREWIHRDSIIQDVKGLEAQLLTNNGHMCTHSVNVMLDHKARTNSPILKVSRKPNLTPKDCLWNKNVGGRKLDEL